MKLYGYWRSSASYRIRLALTLKGMAYESVSTDLLEGAQFSDGFSAMNPQQLVPVLEVSDGVHISQSQAILDYLEAAHGGKRLLPQEPIARAQAMAFGAAIACEIHPLGNVRVQKYVGQTYGVGRDGGQKWAAHWITKGFDALEVTAQQRKTPFLFGEQPGYAECFLIPQVYNAVRYGVAMDAYPTLSDINAKTLAWPGVAGAMPEA